MERTQEAVMKGILRERRDKLQQTIAGSREAEQLVKLLHEVDAALEKIDAGSYGICELCSGEIEEGYLRANPVARICLSHLSEEQQHAIERDLSLASTIQGKLLPTAVTHLPGWEIVHRYQPLGLVSGDICDVIKSDADSGEAFFLFGDVSGKGVAASLLMSHLHAIFRSLAGTGMPLARLVERANRLFCEGTMSLHYATLVWGQLDSGGHMEICNAGHCPPMLIGKGGVTCVEATGLPVGLFYGTAYEARQLHLQPGDTLLLYTDGLTETHNSAEEEYGDERLGTLVVNRARSLPVNELIGACLDDVASFRGNAPRTDDLTVMGIRRSA